MRKRKGRKPSPQLDNAEQDDVYCHVTEEALRWVLDGTLAMIDKHPRKYEDRLLAHGYYRLCRQLRKKAGSELFIEYVRRYQDGRTKYRREQNLVVVPASVAAAMVVCLSLL